MTINERICKTFADDNRVDAVFLLGSAVNGQMRSDSDIDIALLPSKGTELDAITCNEMVSSLALDSGKEIDVGIISSDNLIYAYQAVMTGRQIFSRDQYYVDNMVAFLLGMYGQFNLERMEVCDAYSA